MPFAGPALPPAGQGPQSQRQVLVGNPEPGWTEFTPSWDTKVFYVSSSTGNDSWNGLAGTYKGTVSGLPGLTGPKKTLSAGVSALQDGWSAPGRPDWLLFKRGDQWLGQEFGYWNKSGRSPTERLVIGAYGSGDRPHIRTDSTTGYDVMFGSSGAGSKHVAIVDLKLSAQSQITDIRGIELDSGFDFLIEGCFLTGFSYAFLFQGADNIACRRNVVYQNRGQGWFSHYSDGLTIDDNIVIKAGLPNPDTYKHGIYIDNEGEPTNITISNNILWECSCNAIQLRPGGVCTGNNISKSGVGILLGGGDSWWVNTNGVVGAVRGNVITDLGDKTVCYGLGWGIDVNNISSAIVENNLVANSPNASTPSPIKLGDLGPSGRVQNLTVRENIVYGCTTDTGFIDVMVSGTAPLENLVIRGNQVHGGFDPDPLIKISSSGVGDKILSADNRFYSPAAASEWFLIGGEKKSLAEYKDHFVPKDTTSYADFSSWYPNPANATLTKYAEHVLGAGKGYNDLVAEAIQQQKGAWNLAYTAEFVNKWMRAQFGITDEDNTVNPITVTKAPVLPGAGGFTSPGSSSGWTKFTLRPAGLGYPDPARPIYVDPNGSDSNNGLTTNTPVKTLSKGKSLIRNGYGDWLLLKCGGSWNETLGRLNLSGYSAAYPLLISSYGTGPRPRLIVPADDALLLTLGSDNLRYLAIVDIYAEQSGGTGAGDGIAWVSGGGNLLVEGCYLTGWDQAFQMLGGSNFLFRRNVIADCWGQGAYVENVSGITFAENVIDNVGFPNPDIYKHGLYIQKVNVSGVVIQDNIISQTSSHGIQLRPGGVVRNNLFARNSIAILLGGSDAHVYNPPGVVGTIVDNVILDGKNIDGGNQRGWGINVENASYALIQNNILANNPLAGFPRSIDLGRPGTVILTNISLFDNIVYRWGGAGVDILHNAGASLSNIQFQRNHFQNYTDTSPLINIQDPSDTGAITSGSNKFNSALLGSNAWFLLGGASKSLDQYKVAVGDTTSVAQAVIYPNPSAGTISGYHASLGKTATHAAFMAECRLQRKGYWRTEYTAPVVNTWIRAQFGK